MERDSFLFFFIRREGRERGWEGGSFGHLEREKELVLTFNVGWSGSM